MGQPFRDAVKAAGLDPELITPHVMRHTAITKLVQAGVDLPTVQRISGHKTLAMVLRYAHVHGRHIDQAIQALGRKLPERPVNDARVNVSSFDIILSRSDSRARTIPQHPANKAASAITQELHTRPRRRPRSEGAAKRKLEAVAKA
jgi:hypothetical protein